MKQLIYLAAMHQDDLTAIVNALAGDMPTLDIDTIDADRLLQAGKKIADAHQDNRDTLGRIAAACNRQGHAYRAIAEVFGVDPTSLWRWATKPQPEDGGQ